MSVSNLDSSSHSSNQPNPNPNANQPSQDPLDRWLFRLFKIVLFIIAVWALWKFLNEHVPIGEGIRSFFHWLRS